MNKWIIILSVFNVIVIIVNIVIARMVMREATEVKEKQIPEWLQDVEKNTPGNSKRRPLPEGAQELKSDRCNCWTCRCVRHGRLCDEV